MAIEYYKSGVKAPDGYEETLSVYMCDRCGLREAEYGPYCENCAHEKMQEQAEDENEG